MSRHPLAPGERAFLALLLGGALAARVAWVFATDAAPNFQKYFFLARRLAEAGWVPGVAFTSSPLYTYLVGLQQSFLGLGETGVRLLQAGVGAATLLPAWLAARRLWGTFAAGAAAVLLAGNPVLLLYDTEPLTFVWENFCNAWALHFLLLAEERRRPGPLAAAGAALGCSALLRPNVLLWAVPLLAWAVLRVARERPVGARATAAAALLLPAAAVIAPVTAMNTLADGGPVLVTASGGSTLYGGNNPDTTGIVFSPPAGNIGFQLAKGYEAMTDVITPEHLGFRRLAEWAEGRALTAREASSFWAGEVRAFARREPARFLRLQAAKLRHFFHAYESHDVASAFVRGEPIAAADRVAFSLVWSLGLLGMALAPERRRALPLYALFLVVLLTTVVFYVVSRLRLPAVLPLSLFAGAALDRLRGWLRPRQLRPLLGSAAACVAMAAVFLRPSPVAREDENRSRGYFLHLEPGVRLLRQGRAAEAVAEFRRAVALFPGYSRSVLLALPGAGTDPRLEALRRELSATAGGATGSTGDGAAEYRGHLTQGNTLLLQGRYPEARAELDAAARLQPAAPEPYYLRGFVRGRLADWEGALADHERAFDLGLKFGEDLAGLYADMGHEALMAGDRDRAARYARRALFVDPQLRAAHALLERLGQKG